MARTNLAAACSDARSRKGFIVIEFGMPESGSLSSERASTGPWLVSQTRPPKKISRINTPAQIAIPIWLRENTMVRASVPRERVGTARLRRIGAYTADVQSIAGQRL